jgi:hypothetical protein
MTRNDRWALLQTLVALQSSRSENVDSLDASLGIIALGNPVIATWLSTLKMTDAGGRALIYQDVLAVILGGLAALALASLLTWRAAEQPDVDALVGHIEHREDTALAQAIREVHLEYRKSANRIRLKYQALRMLVFSSVITIALVPAWPPLLSALGRATSAVTQLAHGIIGGS